MKKYFIALTLLAGLLSGCNNQPKTMTNQKRTLALEAVSSLNLIKASNKLLKKNNTEPSFNIEEIVNKTNALLETKLIVTETTSDKEEYSNKQEIQLEENNYTLYYNVKEKVENDDDEVETKKFYTGILINNDINYNFKAFEENEIEDNEIENTLHFKLEVNENTFISVKQEYEQEDNEEEVSFKYSYIENGREIEKFKIKKEIENNQTEIKLEENNQEYKLSYFTKDNQEYLKLKYNGEKYLYKIIIDQDTNVKSYQLVD